MPNTELLDAPPVCMRTLTKSSGWPTRTAHAPPTPPDMKDLSALSDFLVGASSLNGVAGFVGWDGTATAGMSVVLDVVDMLLVELRCLLSILDISMYLADLVTMVRDYNRLQQRS